MKCGQKPLNQKAVEGSEKSWENKVIGYFENQLYR